MSARTRDRIILGVVIAGITLGILRGLPDTIEALSLVLGL